MKIKAIPRYDMYTKKRGDDNLLDKVKVISINESNSPAVFFEMTHPNLLTLHFDDIENEMPTTRWKIFTLEMAEEVMDFLKTIDPVKDDLIVHCQAGVSRSGAVVTFAREYFAEYIDYDEFLEDNKQVVPNLHVLTTLRKVGFGTTK